MRRSDGLRDQWYLFLSARSVFSRYTSMRLSIFELTSLQQAQAMMPTMPKAKEAYATSLN